MRVRRTGTRSFIYGSDGFYLPARARTTGRLWTPALITTSMWLDASLESSMTQSASLVSEWRDAKSNGVNVTQSSGSARPTLVLNSLASKPALSFNGTSTFFTNANAATVVNSQGSFQYRVVFRANSITGSSTGGSTGNNSSIVGANANGGFLPNLYLRTGNIIGTGSYSGSFQNSETLYTPGNWAIAGARHAGGTTLSYNGAYAAALGGNFGYSNEYRIGYSTTNVANAYFNGLIAEIVYVAGTISEDVAFRLDGYLAHKWNLANLLPGGHPYKTTAPLP